LVTNRFFIDVESNGLNEELLTSEGHSKVAWMGPYLDAHLEQVWKQAKAGSRVLRTEDERDGGRKKLMVMWNGPEMSEDQKAEVERWLLTFLPKKPNPALVAAIPRATKTTKSPGS